MSLESFLSEITEVFGEPKHVSTKLVEDYPDYKIIEPLRETEPTYGRAYWNELDT